MSPNLGHYYRHNTGNIHVKMGRFSGNIRGTKANFVTNSVHSYCHHAAVVQISG